MARSGIWVDVGTFEGTKLLPNSLSCPRLTEKREKGDGSKWKDDKNVAK